MAAAALSKSVKRIVPLLDRVLVQRVVPPTQSLGGVLLPESAQSRLNQGIVIAVGPGRRSPDGHMVQMSVKEGDQVLLPEYGGNTVKLEKEEFVLYRDDDLLGVLKSE